MRLTEQAISFLSSRESVRLRNKLALALDKSVVTIERWIKSNLDNNLLTTKTAVEIIMEETGLEENQILERIPATAA